MAATPTPDIGFQNFFQATLTGDITASSTDILMDNIPNASQGFLVIEPDSTSNREVIFYTSKTALKVVCPSAADGRGQDDTTAVSHSTGATVIMAPVAAYYEALQDGKAVGVRYSPQASAVNHPTFKNATTGNGVELQATGDDSNIDVRIVPKGTGNVKRGASGGSIDWWEEIGRTTLGSAGDAIVVSSLPARKYLKILVYLLATGGTINGKLTFNSDSGGASNNYAQKASTDFAAAATATGIDFIDLDSSAIAQPQYSIVEVLNIANQEKIVRVVTAERSTAGAGNAPIAFNTVGKWANTSNQISSVEVENQGTGDFAIGSEVVVLGHD